MSISLRCHSLNLPACARYDKLKTMKEQIMIWMMALSSILLPVQAADGRQEALFGGLMRVGAQVLENAAKAHAADQDSAFAPTDTPDIAPDTTRRSWGKRGQAMLDAFVNGASNGVGASLKQALDVLVEKYKEQYKEEGRAYVREAGDLLAQQVLRNEEVAETLTTVKCLCWVVMIYLTLVTILIFFWAWRVKCTTNRLLNVVQELKRSS